MSKIKILNCLLVIQENDGEEYTQDEYTNILAEAISDQTTATVIDGTLTMVEPTKFIKQ